MQIQQLSTALGFLSSSSAFNTGGGFFRDTCLARARFLCEEPGACTGGSVIRRFLERVVGPLRVFELWAVILEERDCCTKVERERVNELPSSCTPATCLEVVILG